MYTSAKAGEGDREPSGARSTYTRTRGLARVRWILWPEHTLHGGTHACRVRKFIHRPVGVAAIGQARDWTVMRWSSGHWQLGETKLLPISGVARLFRVAGGRAAVGVFPFTELHPVKVAVHY